MTPAYDRTLTVQSLGGGGGGGGESCVSPSGEEYVIAEVKFCIASTPLVLTENQMVARTPSETEKNNNKKTGLSFH